MDGGSDGGGSNEDVRKDAVKTHVHQMSATSDGKYVTHVLQLVLESHAKNVYTIFGASNSALSIPPAGQISGFGVNIGGVSPSIWSKVKSAQFDSWLTVGITGGDTRSDLASVGLNFKGWTARSGLHTTNGAVFWMNPDNGPVGDTA